MEDIWSCYKDGRYYYAFGKTHSLNQTMELYHKAVLDEKIKWKYLKSVVIVECEGNNVISKTNVTGQ